MGISTYIPFPKFRFRTMRNEKKNLNRGRKKVAFFYGCFINFYRPDIGRKIIRLLSSLERRRCTAASVVLRTSRTG